MSEAPVKFKLVWEELLSAKEIKVWLEKRKSPERLRRNEFAYPGVYRFIFPKKVDGSASHVPCYVGQGRNVGGRLRKHFAPTSLEEERDAKGKLKTKAGGQVRGNIQNSCGEFTLQIMKIEGVVNMAGVILSQDSFDCPFGRMLLENLAILYSQRIDKFYLLNRGVMESSRNLFRIMREAQAGSRKRRSVVTS